MGDQATDVKDNKVIDPSTVAKPEETNKVTPPAEPSKDVKPAVVPEPTKPVVTPPADDNPMVPRERLNEELKKRHELEERLKALEDSKNQPPIVPSQPIQPVKDEVELLAEQMSEQAGEDDFGNRLLPVQAAKVQLQTMARLQYAQSAGTRLSNNVDDFVKKNPVAAPYAERIKLELSKLPMGVKDNPENVIRKFKELRADDIDRLIVEAEERGKTKALEQKRIVSQAAGEAPSGIPDGKSAGDMLSADEKEFASKHKISYEDYYKNKGTKRV